MIKGKLRESARFQEIAGLNSNIERSIVEEFERFESELEQLNSIQPRGYSIDLPFTKTQQQQPLWNTIVDLRGIYVK